MRTSTFDIVAIGEINADLILSGDVTPAFGQAEKLLSDARLVIGSSAAIFACGAARHLHLASFFLPDALRPEISRLFREARNSGATVSLDKNFDSTEQWNSAVHAQPDLEEAVRFIGSDSK